MAEQGTAGAIEGSQSFGELLRRYRTAAGLSQEELAEQAGLSAHGISDLERGARQRPYPDTVQRLADSLHLDEPLRAALVASARRSGRAMATSASQAQGAMLSQAPSTFVGRNPEFTRLDSRLQEALAGRGGMVVLTGEPGIGKTCLAERFAVRAREAGGLVLWGRCFEGEISAAYAPWAEMLRTHVQTTGPTRLRELLGAGAPALARLAPEIRASLPETPGAAPLEPDEERFRLHDAVAQLFLRIAQDAPVVLVLDDLHWADRDSLRLLRHVARSLRQARLLLIGTYRDVEVNRQHPLAETLAMLRREVDYSLVALKGWSRNETAAYLAVEAGQELPLAFVQRIHEEAGGSPFYTRQLFRHLVEEQTIAKREGRWSTDCNLGELGIPEGVRQVIERRLARLSEPTKTLLRRAAAFARGFDFDILCLLTDLDEATLLDCIDEALAAGLVRAMQGRGEMYDFAHAIVRHTLYDELSPSRRARLHRRIAESMELLESRSGGRFAAEIAAQYHASASAPGVERGVQYAVRAAEQARARYAVDQAVALPRLARDMANQSAPAQRADVLQSWRSPRPRPSYWKTPRGRSRLRSRPYGPLQRIRRR